MQGFDFKSCFIEAQSRKKSTALFGVYKKKLNALEPSLTKAQKNWLELNDFSGAAGSIALVPDEDGALGVAAIGLGEEGEADCFNNVGAATSRLPEGNYHLDGELAGHFEAALAFGLGAYQFDKFKGSANRKDVRLKLGTDIDTKALNTQLSAVYFGRDLINLPANELGPERFESEIKKFAGSHKARVSIVKGDALLSKKFPMIHAVGRAAAEAPRLVELNWGKASDPAITLVGKGICFDTGGLNLKPGGAMSLMKKDMGGAATALTAAALIMGAKLPVKLRVLLAIAENSVAGNAFRPGDILESRKGLSVEIGNTDAEGRLVLADALCYADEAKPEAIFCFATLTGAARVGLGPDLPPYYTDDEKLAKELDESAERVGDYLWRMPFWGPYDKWLASKVADVNHISDGAFAGSITAALFLRRFIENTKRFVHIDLYGWTPKPSPTKPHGGEPQTARAVFDYLKKTYG